MDEEKELEVPLDYHDDADDQDDTPDNSDQEEPSNSASGSDRSGSDHEVDEGDKPEAAAPVVDEWQNFEVPESWMPLNCPRFVVSGIHKDATEAELKALLESQKPLQVRSVHFDIETDSGDRTAIVRLEPNTPVPTSQQKEEQKEEQNERQEAPAATADDKMDTDDKAGAEQKQNPTFFSLQRLANKVTDALRASKEPLTLHGKTLKFYSQRKIDTTLFLTNIPKELSTDDALKADCEKYGVVERCFIMRNAAGESKEYGYVEYSVPSGAKACIKGWLDAAQQKKADRMKQKEGAEDSGVKIEWAKLPKADFVNVKGTRDLFSRVLYVENILKDFTDPDKLKAVFSKYGTVIRVHFPFKSGGHNRSRRQSRGYAFINFKHSKDADAAFRALNGTEHPGIGKLFVSFSSPSAADRSAKTDGRNKSDRQRRRSPFGRRQRNDRNNRQRGGRQFGDRRDRRDRSPVHRRRHSPYSNDRRGPPSSRDGRDGPPRQPSRYDDVHPDSRRSGGHRGDDRRDRDRDYGRSSLDRLPPRSDGYDRGRDDRDRRGSYRGGDRHHDHPRDHHSHHHDNGHRGGRDRNGGRLPDDVLYDTVRQQKQFVEEQRQLARETAAVQRELLKQSELAKRELDQTKNELRRMQEELEATKRRKEEEAARDRARREGGFDDRRRPSHGGDGGGGNRGKRGSDQYRDTRDDRGPQHQDRQGRHNRGPDDHDARRHNDDSNNKRARY